MYIYKANMSVCLRIPGSVWFISFPSLFFFLSQSLQFFLLLFFHSLYTSLDSCAHKNLIVIVLEMDGGMLYKVTKEIRG